MNSKPPLIEVKYVYEKGTFTGYNILEDSKVTMYVPLPGGPVVTPNTSTTELLILTGIHPLIPMPIIYREVRDGVEEELPYQPDHWRGPVYRQVEYKNKQRVGEGVLYQPQSGKGVIGKERYVNGALSSYEGLNPSGRKVSNQYYSGWLYKHSEYDRRGLNNIQEYDQKSNILHSKQYRPLPTNETDTTDSKKLPLLAEYSTRDGYLVGAIHYNHNQKQLEAVGNGTCQLLDFQVGNSRDTNKSIFEIYWQNLVAILEGFRIDYLSFFQGPIRYQTDNYIIMEAEVDQGRLMGFYQVTYYGERAKKHCTTYLGKGSCAFQVQPDGREIWTLTKFYDRGIEVPLELVKQQLADEVQQAAMPTEQIPEISRTVKEFLF